MNVEKKEVPATVEYMLKLTHEEAWDLEVILSIVADSPRQDFAEVSQKFARTLERALESARRSI